MQRGPSPEQRTGPRKRLLLTKNNSTLTPWFLLREMLEAYDNVGVGVGIVNGDNRIQHSNRVADEILATRDGLELTPEGTLRLDRGMASAPQALFDRLPVSKVHDAREQEHVMVLAVPRSSGKRPLTVLVRPSTRPVESLGTGSPSTLVFLIDPERPMKGMEKHVRHAYGLTATETELAMLLMQGNNLNECCQAMAVRRPTAASHLQQLFKKVRVHTQSQLVSVLCRRFGLSSSPNRRTKSPSVSEEMPSDALSLLKSKLGADSFESSFIGR